MNKLDICLSTRKITADSLLKILQKLLKTNDPISEVMLRDAWLEELRKHKEIFPEGWYIPPEHGIDILFSTDNNTKRTSYTTLRDKEYWPRNDVFLDRQNGIIMPYASPIHKEGTIGDFALDIYFGKNKYIINHIKKIFQTVHTIFNHIELGIKLPDLYTRAYSVFRKNNLINEGWKSTTDPTGINIGHTIPIIDKNLLPGKDWKTICKIISSGRKFINAIEESSLQPGMALTIEPRLKSTKDKNLPTMYFHTIVLIHENGGKELLTNFDEIFKLVGMDYML